MIRMGRLGRCGVRGKRYRLFTAQRRSEAEHFHVRLLHRPSSFAAAVQRPKGVCAAPPQCIDRLSLLLALCSRLLFHPAILSAFQRSWQ